MILEKNNKKLFYEDHGEGAQTLLFVHGWMGSSAVWREQISYFAKTNRVVTFDLTGYGQSNKPADLTYAPEVWLDDIDILIDHLNLNNPILIGWSMGGAIGMVYAITRPNVISKLVIVSSTPLLVAESEVFEPAIPPEAAEQLLGAMQQDFSSGARGFVEMMFPESDTEGFKDEFHAISQQTTASVALESVMAAGTADLRPMLNQIGVPTLILHGEADAVCSVGAGQALAEMIPNAQIYTFPGKGHAFFLTDAQAFNKRLEAFI